MVSDADAECRSPLATRLVRSSSSVCDAVQARRSGPPCRATSQRQIEDSAEVHHADAVVRRALEFEDFQHDATKRGRLHPVRHETLRTCSARRRSGRQQLRRRRAPIRCRLPSTPPSLRSGCRRAPRAKRRLARGDRGTAGPAIRDGRSDQRHRPGLPSGSVTSTISTGGSGICSGGRMREPDARAICAKRRIDIAGRHIKGDEFEDLAHRLAIPRPWSGRLLVFCPRPRHRPPSPCASSRMARMSAMTSSAGRMKFRGLLEVRDDVAPEHLDRLHDLVVRHAVDAHHQLDRCRRRGTARSRGCSFPASRRSRHRSLP